MISPFHPVVVRGFSKYTRITTSRSLLQLLGLRAETLGVVEGGVDVVHAARPDDHEQPVVLSVEDVRHALASPQDDLFRDLRQRLALQRYGGGDEARGPLNTLVTNVIQLSEGARRHHFDRSNGALRTLGPRRRVPGPEASRSRAASRLRQPSAGHRAISSISWSLSHVGGA